MRRDESKGEAMKRPIPRMANAERPRDASLSRTVQGLGQRQVLAGTVELESLWLCQSLLPLELQRVVMVLNRASKRTVRNHVESFW